MSDTIKVGFIGAGGNARWHMDTVSKIEGAEITAVCDVAADRAREAADLHRATAYTDYHEMLETEKLDATYISVPCNAHGEVEILAASQGLHFFVEKPVATSMATIEEVAPVVEKAGVITCVGYQLRYLPTSLASKAFISERTVGMVQGRFWGGTPGTGWWRIKSISGGQMLEQATHTVDLLRFFCGDIKSVYSRYALRTMQDWEGFDIPDAYVLTVEFVSGAVGTISATCMLNTGGGSGGTDLDIVMRDCQLHWNYAGVSLQPESSGPLDTGSFEDRVIDQVFIDAVRTGDRSKVLSDYADAAKSAAVSIAANKSAETGEPVMVL